MNKVRLIILSAAASAGCFFLLACGGKGGGGSSNSAQCSNPILINDSSMQRVSQMSSLPTGTFQLSSIQIYFVDQSTNDSFTATATSADGFANVSLDCNGVHSSSGTLTASANAGTSMDFVNNIHSPNSIRLALEFDNGQLAFADTNTIPSDENGLSNSSSDQIPTGRVSLGDDKFMQLSVYSPTSTQIDTRMEIESPADGNGKRILEFIRVLYTKM